MEMNEAIKTGAWLVVEWDLYMEDYPERSCVFGTGPNDTPPNTALILGFEPEFYNGALAYYELPNDEDYEFQNDAGFRRSMADHVENHQVWLNKGHYYLVDGVVTVFDDGGKK